MAIGLDAPPVRRGAIRSVQGCRARASRASTSAQSVLQSLRSASGSLARASASRTPARSVSAFQCWSVCTTAARAWGGPESTSFAQAASSALEPAQGLRRELGLRRVVGGRVVLALAGGGQRGGAGGVVAVLGLAVVAELRVGGQRLGPEPGGGGVALRVVAHLGQGQALGVVPGAVVALEQGGQPRGQRRQPLGLRDPLRRGVAPAGPLRAQLVPLANIRPATRRSRPGVRRSWPRLQWASAWSGLSRMASRNAAMASSSFPWPLRAMPRL